MSKNILVNKCFLLILIILTFSVGKAQEEPWENPNYRKFKIATHDSIILDSLSILPSTLSITNSLNETIDSSDYTFNSQWNSLRFNYKNIDSVWAEYYVHPNLKPIFIYAKDPGIIIQSHSNEKKYEINTRPKNQELFNGLQSNGSIVRGITFGNNQGGSVQSSLDLQLTGKLSEDLFINAAIADNNAPIEADGYTQNLEQFDRVYVEIYNKYAKLKAGHIDLEQNQDYFGQFNRKVTGLQLSTQIEKENSTTRIHATGSVSRGDFVQQKFNGIEGNQGPYKLTGNNNEAFIIILSGSERIYIDGVLLTRGETNDYVMNYNTGELTFTTNQLIRANHRITAEYLYTTRNYNRFLVYGGAEHESKKFSLGVHMFSESDNKNNPINQNLSNEDKQILADAGNDVDQMIALSANEVPYSANKILYKKIDVGNTFYFEYSNNPSDVLYEVFFTQVGKGKGDYILTDAATNGRVFEYIPPVNGISQGNYAPIRRLVPPVRKQLLSLNSHYTLGKNTQLGLDLGLSNNDQNLYSNLDNNENIGWAAKFNFNHIRKWGNFQLQPFAEYSFIQKQFNPLQRLRTPEFARDFNLPTELLDANQNFLRAGIQSNFKDQLRTGYELYFLENSGISKGIKQELKTEYTDAKTTIRARGSALKSEYETEKATFNSYDAIAERKIKSFTVSAGILGEENNRKITQDSINPLSFKWNEIFTAIGVGDSVQRFAKLRLYKRQDDSVRLNSLGSFSQSYGAEFNTRFLNQQNHRLDLNSDYRRVKYAYENETRDYLTGNITWYKAFFDKGVALNIFYELGGGTEPERAFTYVKVTDGMGIYQWTDYNGDGVEQLDEFEVATFSDRAQYIRVYTNTVNYLETQKNALTLSVKFYPGDIWENPFLGRFNLQFTLNNQNRYERKNRIAVWNPFEENDETRAAIQTLRGIVNFNQSKNYKWGANYQYIQQNNKTLVYVGEEGRKQQEHQFKALYRPNDFWLYEINQMFNSTKSESQSFATRRYLIKEWILNPKINYIRNENWQTSFGYEYKNALNREGEEKLGAHQLKLDAQWNDKGKTSLVGSFYWVENKFTGNEFSVVGNRMMQGLKNGSNLVWNVLLQRQLNNFLELNLSYNGRKSDQTDAIHTGSLQLRARF